jgi:IS5 family transposase
LIIVDVETKEIIAIYQDKGSAHDFSIFKRSKITLHELLVLLADSGFQGIEAFHRASWIPFKRSKNNPLTNDQKNENKVLSSIRVCVEHTIRRIKRFKILSCRYRNKRKRHGLRMALICGLYNYEIS